MRSRLLFVCVLSCTLTAIAADNESLASVELRLTTPLTSYGSKPGTGFQSVVISSRQDSGHVFLPPGTIVHGAVRKQRTVGLGIVHERAGLELEFKEYELADGRRYSFQAKLHSLDNAREAVTKSGSIQGVLAARTPHSYLSGVWHRPSVDLFGKAFLGLSGASGKIAAAADFGPIGATALFAVRCLIFRIAEPEIQLPVGAEMRINVLRVSEDSPEFVPEEAMEVVPELAGWLLNQPSAIQKPDGHKANDIINLAIAGTQQQVEAAFQAAGWQPADPRSLKSFSHIYMAFNRQTAYPTAPTSRLLYDKREPDIVFQKSLDTFAKRHHIRLWKVSRDGEEIWLGAATQDIAIAMREGSFTHLIHPKIDNERQKIVADLGFAGCIEGVGFVERPTLARTVPEKKGSIVTDGKVAVVPLQHSCTQAPLEIAEASKSPHSGASGIARRMILQGRYYVLRSNVYYMAYDFFAWRHANRLLMARALAE